MKIGSGRRGINLLIADYVEAGKFWMPTIAGRGPFGEFSDVSATTPFLISGPYLVRTAKLSGGLLSLTGDLEVDVSTELAIVGTRELKAITWNGTPLLARYRADTFTWTAKLGANAAETRLPDVTTAVWKYADSLPEVRADFDDSALVLANHTTTTSVFPPYYGGPWILYADDYGFHVSYRRQRAFILLSSTEGRQSPMAWHLQTRTRRTTSHSGEYQRLWGYPFRGLCVAQRTLSRSIGYIEGNKQ